MNNELARMPPTAIGPPLDDLADEARRIIDKGRSANTHRAYKQHWGRFVTWCRSRNLTPLPADPATVILYLTERSITHRVATVGLDATAIGAAHRQTGDPNPCSTEPVRAFMRGLRRDKGIARNKKTPMSRALMEAGLPDATDMRTTRDRALLLLGWWSGVRRAELCALTLGDVEVRDGRLVLRIRRSKTDQEGAGQAVGVSRVVSGPCPVVALTEWLALRNLANPRPNSFSSTAPADRPLFPRLYGDACGPRPLHPTHVAKAVKACAERGGADPSPYSGHSLRAGLATEAAQAGVEARLIQRQLRHRTSAMTAEYIHDASVFDNAASVLAKR